MPAPISQSDIRRRAALLALAAAAATVAVVRPAFAVTRFQRSVYTAFAISDCQPLPPPPAGGEAYLCPGLPGFPLVATVTQGHAYLGLGSVPRTSKAATQSLSAANTLLRKAAGRVTVEWRVVIRNGRKEPYAAIVRAFTHSAGVSGQVLLVYRIAGSEACLAGVVDALANDQPIVLAHAFADTEARAFDCAREPRVIGETGISPM